MTLVSKLSRKFPVSWCLNILRLLSRPHTKLLLNGRWNNFHHLHMKVVLSYNLLLWFRYKCTVLFSLLACIQQNKDRLWLLAYRISHSVICDVGVAMFLYLYAVC